MGVGVQARARAVVARAEHRNPRVLARFQLKWVKMFVAYDADGEVLLLLRRRKPQRNAEDKSFGASKEGAG